MARAISFFLLVLAMFGGAGFARAHAAAPFTQDLFYGIRKNDEVKRLQEFLAAESFYQGPATGNFLSLTRDAVEAYQKSRGISPALGYFGPLTRASVNARLSAAPLSPAEELLRKIRDLEAQVVSLRALLAEALAGEGSSTPPLPPPPPPAEPETATTTFSSALRIRATYPSITLSRYIGVTLGEFEFIDAQETVAVTRIKFYNSGTLPDGNIINLRLETSGGAVLATSESPRNGVIDFVLTSDETKTDRNLIISGKTYHVTADIITPNAGGSRPTVRLDILSSLDITAADFYNFSRIATFSETGMFPIIGATITTF